MKPKISISIGDSPININVEDVFELASKLKVDGVEIVLGLKTKGGINQLSKLSSKYNVPILSIHEPLSFGSWFFKKEDPFIIAKNFKSIFNIHPKIDKSIYDLESEKYFNWISKTAKNYNVSVLLENMALKNGILLFDLFFKFHKSACSLIDIEKIAVKNDFFMTLDTAHLQYTNPHKMEGFDKFLKRIKNIHLSDFGNGKQHLPLGKGELNMEGFLKYLKEENYNQIITLELSPTIFLPKKNYFFLISDSIAFIKRIWD